MLRYVSIARSTVRKKCTLRGGNTTLENLALACVSCSLRKGARLLVRDPQTGEHVTLFHPRLDSWRAHFRWEGVRVAGITPTGRATVVALSMNRPLALAIREEEAHRGRHPPQAHISGASDRVNSRQNDTRTQSGKRSCGDGRAGAGKRRRCIFARNPGERAAYHSSGD
jgi:hypothetical protein